MIYTKLTVKAMQIAYKAHHGQYDVNGVPYIFHPYHIAEQMTDEITVCTALLHDVVEDTDMTFEEVVVETGAQTDYYIEIHGDGLEEGMEVRASADLTEATYTAAEDETEENEGVLNIRGGMGNVGQATNGGNRTGMPNGGGMPGQMPGGM